MIDESDLASGEVPAAPAQGDRHLRESLPQILRLLQGAKRPLLVAGHGIRISESIDVFEQLAEALGAPIVTTFNGFDLVADEHPLYCGRIGTIGNRSGNFALQNADVVLFLGTRNNIRQVSYNWGSFAHRATRIVVDIDNSELQKPTVRPSLEVHADLRCFLPQLRKMLVNTVLPDKAAWVEWCKARLEKYPVVLPEHRTSSLVNPYHFSQALTEVLPEDTTVVCGNGSACVCMFQAGVVKRNQRVFWNSGCASMGYDLPAAIGACIGNGGRTTVCIAGDGSIMMNLQELQTVKHHELPLKIFVLDNDGYQSIRQTQSSFFGPPLFGCDQNSGISFPDFCKVAEAFGIRAECIASPIELSSKMPSILTSEEPILCQVKLGHDYVFSPKLSSKRMPDGAIVSKPLEDMYPFLTDDELRLNSIPN